MKEKFYAAVLTASLANAAHANCTKEQAYNVADLLRLSPDGVVEVAMEVHSRVPQELHAVKIDLAARIAGSYMANDEPDSEMVALYYLAATFVIARCRP